MEQAEVIGGIISPVHDAYGKKGLIPQTHRLAMVKLALKTSDWIRVSDWETQQEGWTRTKNTLQFHQNYLNSIIRDLNGISSNNLPSWVPENIKQIKEPVRIKLLCGADLLESFATPDLWDKEDVSVLTFNLKSSKFHAILSPLTNLLQIAGSNTRAAWNCRYIKKWLRSREIYLRIRSAH